MSTARKETIRLLDMIATGVIAPEAVVTMCLSYMSEADVADMLDMNELSPRFSEDKE